MRYRERELSLTNLPDDPPWKGCSTRCGAVIWDGSPAGREGSELLWSLVEGDLAVEKLGVVSHIGTHADVYRLGSLAVKVFGKRRGSFGSGISGAAYLQMSVALEQGLSFIQKKGWQDDPAHVYAAPRMYGSFIVSNRRSGYAPITVMSFEEGSESQLWEGLPRHRTRRNICRQAIEIAGLIPTSLVIDRNPENLLVESIDNDTTRIVQLDVMSRERGLV